METDCAPFFADPFKDRKDKWEKRGDKNGNRTDEQFKLIAGQQRKVTEIPTPFVSLRLC